MFYVSDLMAALWTITGLGTFAVKQSTTTVAGGRLSVVYAAAVYVVYAFLGAASVSGILGRYSRAVRTELQDPGATARLQIWMIRDVGIVLLFVATTTVYWSVSAYRREHERLFDEHVAIAKQLFGCPVHGGRTSYPTHRAVAACCWALYVLLAVGISLDVSRYTDQVSWTYLAVYAWGHYGLLTGNIQFAVIVFGLRQSYRELNARMRAGRPERRNNAFDYNVASPAAHTAETSTQSLSAPEFTLRDVMFVSGENPLFLISFTHYTL